mgnify:CR=1 FL=1
MSGDRLDQQIRLPDGRLLGYAECGDPRGRPVFFFHGFPSSRLEGSGLDAVARRLGIRLIAPDRPGIGLSDFKEGRTTADWPSDVACLADALQLARFAALGGSGGAKYAAACAALIPERLTAAAIYSCAAPLEGSTAADGESLRARLGWRALRLAAGAPWLTAVAAEAQWRTLRLAPYLYLTLANGHLSASDQAVLAKFKRGAARLANLREAYRSGTRGVAWELLLLARPWGFRLRDIPLRVHLWHGEADLVTPPSMGRYLAERIPDCVAKFYAEEGHISLLLNHSEEILGALLTSRTVDPGPEGNPGS